MADGKRRYKSDRKDYKISVKLSEKDMDILKAALKRTGMTASAYIRELIRTGGNIDTRLLANVLLRDLARSGRIARLRIRLQDRPGALFKVMKLFDEKQVNIIEIYHQRIFTTLPAKGLITDIECEARDKEHLDSLVASLRDAGYMVTTVELA